jgi:hypothetical protein
MKNMVKHYYAELLHEMRLRSSTTPLRARRNRSPGSIPTHQSKKKFKTVQSPGNVVVTFFWDVYGVLFIDFTPPGSKTSTAAWIRKF